MKKTSRTTMVSIGVLRIAEKNLDFTQFSNSSMQRGCHSRLAVTSTFTKIHELTWVKRSIQKLFLCICFGIYFSQKKNWTEPSYVSLSTCDEKTFAELVWYIREKSLGFELKGSIIFEKIICSKSMRKGTKILACLNAVKFWMMFRSCFNIESSIAA